MLKMAFTTGLKLDEFWDMTFSEFTIWIDAFKDKQQYETEKMITQSYLTAALSRTSKLPDLKELLEDVKENNEEMTDEKLFMKIQKLQRGGKK
jgi:uncharacterized protein YcbK (DUF882 family)